MASQSEAGVMQDKVEEHALQAKRRVMNVFDLMGRLRGGACGEQNAATLTLCCTINEATDRLVKVLEEIRDAR